MRRVRRQCSGPLVMFGDFNKITSLDEEGVTRVERCVDLFRRAIDDCGLCDLKARGPRFT